MVELDKSEWAGLGWAGRVSESKSRVPLRSGGSPASREPRQLVGVERRQLEPLRQLAGAQSAQLAAVDAPRRQLRRLRLVDAEQLRAPADVGRAQ